MRTVNLEQKIAKDCAAENSYGKSGDADARREQDAAENDSDVVDDRRERRNYELAFGVLHCAEDAAFVETDLRGKHDAGEEDDALALGGIETRSDDFYQLRRENLAGDDERDEHE